MNFKPAAVTYPTSADEVAAVIKAAAANNLPVVARSGGHSYAGNGHGGADGAVVVDLSNLSNISVDSSTNVATIGTGNRLGDVALALNNAGRAIPHGTCPYVGIGGHSGHGGFGFTSRMWGLTLDTITSLDVVLANGSIVTASETQNPDLFWAMRGSASSFGITTSLSVKTFAAPSYAINFQYTWDLTAAAAADALGSFQDFVTSNIPAELGMELVVGKGSSSGKVNFGLTGSWYGDQQAVNTTIKPFIDSIPSQPTWIDFSGNGTWIDSLIAWGGGSVNTKLKPDSNDTFYAKSLMTPTDQPLTADARTAFMSYLATVGFSSNLNWFMEVELYGGSNSAVNAVPSDATAFVHRDSIFTWQLYASSPTMSPPFPDSGFDFLDDLVGNFTSAMPSDWKYGAYLNYVDNRLQNWQELYYAQSYSRLQSIKSAVDPNNVFKFPLSVQAAAASNSSDSSGGSGSGSGGSDSGSPNPSAATRSMKLPWTFSRRALMAIHSFLEDL